VKKLETELKLTYPSKEDLLAVVEEPWFKQYLLPEPSTRQELESSYLDTREHLLRKKGAVVRVRQVDGEEFIHTVKVSSGGSEGLHQRFEWNYKTKKEHFDVVCFLEQAKSDDDPYSILASVLSPIEDSSLICVLKTRFSRIAFLSGIGHSILEIALDFGEIIAGDKREEICEMEIELLEGDVRDLLSLGEIIMTESSCKPENESKYGRGLRLLESEEAL